MSTWPLFPVVLAPPFPGGLPGMPVDPVTGLPCLNYDVPTGTAPYNVANAVQAFLAEPIVDAATQAANAALPSPLTLYPPSVPAILVTTSHVLSRCILVADALLAQSAPNPTWSAMFRAFQALASVWRPAVCNYVQSLGLTSANGGSANIFRYAQAVGATA